MNNPHAYYLSVNQKAYDIDGAYGAQCWDGFAHFTRKYFSKQFNCSATGFAIDLWNLRRSSGITKYFDLVTNPNDLKDGDWVVFKIQGATPQSHVGMFRKWVKKGKTFIVLAQNQGGFRYPKGGSAFNQVAMSSASMAGAFRPKIFKPATPKPKPKPAPKPPAKVYVTVKPGWGLSSIAIAAGYKDSLSQARWGAIAKLNGSNNWKTFNSNLKPGQKVRVK